MAATMSAWSKPGAWALDAEENETELLQQRKEDDNPSHGGETADFPSLSAAGAKAKKKKPQTVSLQEFTTGKTTAPRQQKGLTPDELFALPTGPRQRTAEELDRDKQLGGGFRSYGGGGGARENQPRRREESNREQSRADETDDWGAGKRSTVNSGFDRGERGNSFGNSQSRADEVGNWASGKSFVPSESRKYEKSSSGGSDSSNWGRKREEVSGGGGGGGRPRLNLQPRTLPVNEEIGNVVKAKGNDPFGDARPREEVLKDMGKDWKEIEEKLESVKIKEVVSGGRERSWRRPESADSHPQSAAAETEKGNDERCEEDGEGRDS